MTSSFTRFWTRSISRQLILGIALVHAVLMSIFVYDLVGRERNFMLTQSHTQALGLAKTLAANSSSWVLANDFIGLEEVITSQSGFPDLSYAMVTDLSGKVLGFTNRKIVGQFLADDISLAMLASDKALTLINKPVVIDVAAPIFSGKTQIGWARVAVSRLDISNNLQVVTRNGMLYTLLAISIGVLFAWFMARGFTFSIRQLENSLDQIKMGKRDINVVLNRHDELGLLSQHLARTVVSLDTAEQKLISNYRQLTEQESQLRSILSDMADSVITINSQGIILSFNKAAETLFGYSAEEAIGQNIALLVPEPEDKDYGNHLQSFVKTAKAHVSGIGDEAEGQQKSGLLFPIHLSIAEINNNMFVGLIRDISIEKQLQEELEARVTERTQKLNDVNIELNKFAYAVSHDLKAPLRAINQLSGWIEDDYAEAFDDAGRSQMTLLRSRAKRMHDMINGILLYSRLGRDKINYEKVDLNILLANIVQMMAPPEHIKVEIQANLPTIIADDLRLFQVVQNLVDNAIKYNDKSEGLIQIGVEETEYEWQIFVQDNGLGIEEEHQHKIFELFQTLAPKDDNNSTGIGLSLVEKSIAHWGGSITLESVFGKGCKFTITVPKERQEGRTK